MFLRTVVERYAISLFFSSVLFLFFGIKGVQDRVFVRWVLAAACFRGAKYNSRSRSSSNGRRIPDLYGVYVCKIFAEDVEK